MKRIQFIITLIFFTTALLAQKAAVNEFAVIDKKALQLPDSLSATTEGISNYITANFKTAKEKSRAIFIWTATNIQYDIDNMFALNFYESTKDKIEKALKNKKGICENYAALFNDICQKSGIKSFVIEGYTKQNGFTDYIPHAWCAALIDSAWYLFDPTWGSGYISNKKFYRHINNNYYKANPSVLIKSHMPFDPLWQFLNYPITNQEFYDGNIAQNKQKPYFNFIDSINVFEKQEHVEQLESAAARIEKNGLKNSLLFDRLQHIKLEIENIRQNKVVDLYNGAAADYNEGINSFNTYSQYWNKQFTPVKPDAEIQQMLDTVAAKFKAAKEKLSKIINPRTDISAVMVQLNKSIDDAERQLKEQQEWLTNYFSKSKSKRKSMFYEKKITLFGKPLN
jgi:transglutaminase/protease-like cytokinesis protein 3